MTLIEKHSASLNAASHIPTWTTKDELAWLAEEASKRWFILEIGTYKGHSAIVLARSTKGRVACFDMCPDPGVEDAARGNLKDEANVDLLHGDAGVSAVHWSMGWRNKFDMIWIDDGHTYADVVRDCLIALSLRIDESALICGHDYEGEVKKAVDDCFGAVNVKRGPGSIWYL